MLSSLDNDQFRKTLLSWPEKAMVLLYQDHYESLMRIADMHTRDRHASQDVLQEVFANIWRKRRKIGQQRNEPIHGYLIRAVQYHAISLYRKNTKTADEETHYYYAKAASEVEDPSEAVIISQEKQSFIRLIVATFPERERQCLLLQIDHSLPVGEIAQRLGISRKAVERSLTSGKKRLKKFRAAVS